jgi:outer membrane protein assembly factor BamB
MSLLALVLAAQASVATQLPPAPVRLWTIRWQKQLVAPVALEWKARESGGPVVDSTTGRVVVGTRDGWLRAYSPDGALAWELQASGRFEASPRIDGNTIYAGSSDGFLYAVDVGSGQLRWKYDAQEEVGTTPAVAGGLVLAMTLQDTLVAVDAKSGTWKWHHRREPREGFTIRGAASPVVSGAVAFGAYSDGNVAALDLLTGTVQWERKVAPAGDFVDVDALQVQGGRLFAAAFSGAVYALDAKTGLQQWELKTPNPSRLALGGGLLVAVTNTQVLGISPQDGAVRWTVPLEGAPAGEPVVANGRAAVPNGEGLLWIDTRQGRVLRVFNPGTGVSAAPGWSGSRLYVLSNGGTLLALDLS